MCKNKAFSYSDLWVIFGMFSISYCCCRFFSVFLEPSTEIIGAPDLYIESGSTINLTCVVHNSPEPPAFIFWNHNNAVSSARWQKLPSYFSFTSTLCSFEPNVNLKNSKNKKRTKRHIKDRGSMQWSISHHHNTHFISFMSHWKHLLKMDFHPWFLPVSYSSKVEILWPPCPLHRTAAEKRRRKWE